MKEQKKLTRRLVRRIYDRAMTLIMIKGWCQGSEARDKRGRPVGRNALAASCFCAGGAVNRVVDRLGFSQEFDDLVDADPKTPSYAEFNDAPGRRKTQVVKFLRDECERICKELPR